MVVLLGFWVWLRPPRMVYLPTISVQWVGLRSDVQGKMLSQTVWRDKKRITTTQLISTSTKGAQGNLPIIAQTTNAGNDPLCFDEGAPSTLNDPMTSVNDAEQEEGEVGQPGLVRGTHCLSRQVRVAFASQLAPPNGTNPPNTNSQPNNRNQLFFPMPMTPTERKVLE